MKVFLVRNGQTVFSVIASRKKVFAAVTLGLIAASLLINVTVLSALTGRLPSAFIINDGSFKLQANLNDPVDQLLEAVFPLYNYPLALVTFPREFVVTNELGLKENVIASQPLFLNIHYFVDFVPFALLISAYVVVSRHYFSGLRRGLVDKGKRSKDGIAVSALSTATPSVGSGATTALTALAGGICCGAFAVESSIYVLGMAISAAGLVFFSRIFLLAMAGFLILGVLRTAHKINRYCALPRKEISR